MYSKMTRPASFVPVLKSPELLFTRRLAPMLANALAIIHSADATLTLPRQVDYLTVLEQMIDPILAQEKQSRTDTFELKNATKFTFFGASYETDDAIVAAGRLMLLSGPAAYEETTLFSQDLAKYMGRDPFKGSTQYLTALEADMRLCYTWEDSSKVEGLSSSKWYGNRFDTNAASTHYDDFHSYPHNALATPGKLPTLEVAVSTTQVITVTIGNSCFQQQIFSKRKTMNRDGASEPTFVIRCLRALTRHALIAAYPRLASSQAGLFTPTALGLPDDSNSRADVRHKAVSNQIRNAAAVFHLLPYITLDALFTVLLTQPTINAVMQAYLTDSNYLRRFNEATATVAEFHKLPETLRWIPGMYAPSKGTLPDLIDGTATFSPQLRLAVDNEKQELEAFRSGRPFSQFYPVQNHGLDFPLIKMKVRAGDAPQQSTLNLQHPNGLEATLLTLLRNRISLYERLKGSSSSSPGGNALGFAFHLVAKACGWSAPSGSAAAPVVSTPICLITEEVTEKPFDDIASLQERVYLPGALSYGAEAMVSITQSATDTTFPASDAGGVFSVKGGAPVTLPIPTRRGVLLRTITGGITDPREFKLVDLKSANPLILGNFADAFTNNAISWTVRLRLPSVDAFIMAVKDTAWLWSDFFAVDGDKLTFKEGLVLTSERISANARTATLSLATFPVDKVLAVDAERPITAISILSGDDVKRPLNYLRDSERPVSVDDLIIASTSKLAAALVPYGPLA